VNSLPPNALINPVEVFIKRLIDRHAHDFRNRVTMKLPNPTLQLFESTSRGFDQKQQLIRPRELALPNVPRSDSRQDVHARRKFFTHDGLRDRFGLLFRFACYKHDNFIAHLVNMNPL
jgi:hypothetical protein